MSHIRRIALALFAAALLALGGIPALAKLDEKDWNKARKDLETGLNGEEAKMISETHRIWNDTTVKVTPMCVRVPVLRAHSQSINVTLKKATTEEQVRGALSKAAGVSIVDDRAANRFPTPLKASGGDDVLVGRIRRDPAGPVKGPTTTFDLFIAGDQLRKGAALNAVQIAELLMR